MIYFSNDYLEGAHERIIEKITQTNMAQSPGYGLDDYCDAARAAIRKACALPDDTNVTFVSGGTQANLIVIRSILRPHQGVISSDQGHIATHESGAIEATGHKVLALDSCDGKITAEQVLEAYNWHYAQDNREHIVQPGMVYISHPTEFGTLYSRDELAALSKVCKECGLPLFLDGARLGYALAAEGSITLEEIAKYVDVFYIGGTKVGALFGEAIVIVNGRYNHDFTYYVKMSGALLAKGRMLGLQFLALFEDGLYHQIGAHAVNEAKRIKEAFIKKGIKLHVDSSTNQQFPILSNEAIEKLGEKYVSCFWDKIDDTHSCVRFCTSWATKSENVTSLIKDIEAL